MERKDEARPLAMHDRKAHFLSLYAQLPARLLAEEVAWVLNCQAHDVPVLVAAGLLKPLGKPEANSVKYFATLEVQELARDRTWLAKMTKALCDHWREKNRRRERLAVPISMPAASLRSASQVEFNLQAAQG
jgi:hypothetical protein